MKYELTASNKQGCITGCYGNTKKECLSKFDAKWQRKGFVIWIENTETGEAECIKKTYR